MVIDRNTVTSETDARAKSGSCGDRRVSGPVEAIEQNFHFQLPVRGGGCSARQFLQYQEPATA